MLPPPFPLRNFLDAKEILFQRSKTDDVSFFFFRQHLRDLIILDLICIIIEIMFYSIVEQILLIGLDRSSFLFLFYAVSYFFFWFLLVCGSTKKGIKFFLRNLTNVETIRRVTKGLT